MAEVENNGIVGLAMVDFSLASGNPSMGKERKPLQMAVLFLTLK